MPEQLDRVRLALADRYAVDREVGSGGMATVYLARDLKHDRQVAIKVLRHDLAATLGAQRFLQEIKVTAKLSNPHILPLLDSGEASGVLYYVMPFVEGESLRDRLEREGPLRVEDALRIARDVAVALDHAHRNGIIHRDIKPENILLHDDEAVVADFGIARALSAAGTERMTQTGLAVGTPAYMSPEQASDTTLDARSDIYALGCVLYEMLAGEAPYTGSTPHAILAKRLIDPVPSVRRLRDTVPVSVDAVLMRALAREPADRFATARGFADALGAEPFGSGAVAAGAPPGSRLARRALGVLAVGVVVAVAWVIGLRAPTGTAGSATHVAVLPFSVRGGTEFAYLGDGMVDLLSVKLDGAGTLRSVDPRAVLAVVQRQGSGPPDPEGGSAIAEGLGAGLYVLGNIVEVGGQLRFDASLYDRSRGVEPVAQASAEGGPGAVLGLVDELAGELLAGQEALRGSRLTRIALVTTDSLAALKSYLRGAREFRAAHFPEAAVAFQEALAADTSFALAWYQLSVTADWLLLGDLARDAAERAVRLADRLPERDRRLLEALVTVRRGDAVQAERLYRSILGTYPGEIEAWHQLGEVLFHFRPRLGGKLEESREAWDRLLALEPDQPTAYVHLARVAISAGDSAGLDSMAGRVLELIPEGDRVLEMRTLQAFSHGDSAARDRVLAELRRASDNLLGEVAWSVAAFLGDPTFTEPVARLMTAPSRSVESRALGHVLLAYLELARGRWSRAQEELAEVERLDPAAAMEHRALLSATPFLQVPREELEAQQRRLASFDAAAVPPSASPQVWFAVHNGLHPLLRAYLLGLLNAQMGRFGVARRFAGELDGIEAPPRSGSLREDLARGVRATAALEAGSDEEALEILQGVRLEAWHQLAIASPFFSAARKRYLRARLLHEAGRLQEAIKWYGSFTNVSVHDLTYAARSHFDLGQLYESLGEPERAAQHYARFIELWQDADPELRDVVDEAQQRLAALGG